MSRQLQWLFSAALLVLIGAKASVWAAEAGRTLILFEFKPHGIVSSTLGCFDDWLRFFSPGTISLPRSPVGVFLFSYSGLDPFGHLGGRFTEPAVHVDGKWTPVDLSKEFPGPVYPMLPAVRFVPALSPRLHTFPLPLQNQLFCTSGAVCGCAIVFCSREWINLTNG